MSNRARFLKPVKLMTCYIWSMCFILQLWSYAHFLLGLQMKALAKVPTNISWYHQASEITTLQSSLCKAWQQLDYSSQLQLHAQVLSHFKCVFCLKRPVETSLYTHVQALSLKDEWCWVLPAWNFKSVINFIVCNWCRCDCANIQHWLPSYWIESWDDSNTDSS